MTTQNKKIDHKGPFIAELDENIYIVNPDYCEITKYIFYLILALFR